MPRHRILVALVLAALVAVGLPEGTASAETIAAKARVTCAKVRAAAPNGVARTAAAAAAYQARGFPRPKVDRRRYAAAIRLDRDKDGVVCGRTTAGGGSERALACRLPRAGGRTDVELGFPRIASRLSGTRDARVSVIFTDFADAPATQSTDDVLAASLPGASRILAQQSYGRLRLVPDVVAGWQRMPGSAASYGLADGFTFAEHRAYLQDAVALVDARHDFASTDLLLVIATPNATTIRSSPAFTAGPGSGVTADGREMLNGVTLFSDYLDRKDWNLAHEIGHTTGLVDLYAFGVPGGDPALFGFTGPFDMMGDLAGTAPELLAWDRWQAGWLDDARVAATPRQGRRSISLRSTSP